MVIGDLVSSLSLIIGACGFIFGLYQYYIGQKWKKSEFAAKQLEQLVTDSRLVTCCKILDWSIRKLPVPEEYRLLADQPVFIHDWSTLLSAMTDEKEKGSFEWQEVLYRDLFDHLFSYLERINHYISISLISAQDVSSLKYWLKEIASPRFVETPVFIEYIQSYGYSGVFELMERFHIECKAIKTNRSFKQARWLRKFRL